MPRFTRFVAITTFLLVCLYLFYPSPQTSLNISDVAGSPQQTTPKSALDTSDNTVDRTPIQSSRESSVPTTSGRETLAQKPLTAQTGTLRSQLTAAFPYDVESVFPSFIWQTWRITPSHPDFEFRAEEASWTDSHGGYIHEVCRILRVLSSLEMFSAEHFRCYCANRSQVITDDVASLLVDHLYARVPDVLAAYNALPLPILKADFFRYLILLARGGVYSDIDTQVIRPAWEWVPDELVFEKHGLVIGIEADPDRSDWAEWYSRRVQFCQWTIRSKPGHPALVETVARVAERTLEMAKAGKLAMDPKGNHSIVEWTGPAMWTDAIFDYFNSPVAQEQAVGSSLKTNCTWKDMTGLTDAKRFADVIVLPITGFSPGQNHMGSLNFDDPHAMVKHDFEGTWKPEEERNIGKDSIS